MSTYVWREINLTGEEKEKEFIKPEMIKLHGQGQRTARLRFIQLHHSTHIVHLSNWTIGHLSTCYCPDLDWFIPTAQKHVYVRL